MNEIPKYKQIEKLGIDINLLWDILGGLDNMKILISYAAEELEDYSDVETVEKSSAEHLFSQIRRVMQLTYIFDNEFKHTYKSTETLLTQMDQ